MDKSQANKSANQAILLTLIVKSCTSTSKLLKDSSIDYQWQTTHHSKIWGKYYKVEPDVV